jgi:hypothetical protein
LYCILGIVGGATEHPNIGKSDDHGEGEMYKGRLIGGIICLAAAALLAVLYAVLPAGSAIFMIGDTNMPFVPAIVLAVVGLAWLATARRR